ncbi:FHA domain-containing protein, partial [Georgenia thermotolerans]
MAGVRSDARGGDGDAAGREGLATATLRAAWHLAVVGGPDTGWCLPLGPDATTIGRGGGTLTDPSVSRRHLQARTRRGGVQVRDAGSANGTRWRPPGRLRPARRLGRRWRTVP